MPDKKDERLSLIVRHVLASNESLDDHEPMLRAMLGDRPGPTSTELTEALDGSVEPEVLRLRGGLEAGLLQLARDAHALRQAGQPWTPRMHAEFDGLENLDEAGSPGAIESDREQRRSALSCALRFGTPGASPRDVLVNRAEEEKARRAEEARREAAAKIAAEDVVAAAERETIEPDEAEPEPEPTAVLAIEEPPPPSVWNQHLRPFLLDNWYIAVGALMVVVGSSLLAYFTWDRHWAVRYTVLPPRAPEQSIRGRAGPAECPPASRPPTEIASKP